MKPYVYFFLILIVVSSGCTNEINNISSFSTNGVSSKLSFYPNKINDKQTTMLTLELENDGEVDVNKVTMFLFGLSNDWTVEDIYGTDRQGKINNRGLVKGDFSFEVGGRDVKLQGDLSINQIEKVLNGELPVVDLHDVQLKIKYNGVNIKISDLESLVGLGDGVDIFAQVEVFNQKFSKIIINEYGQQGSKSVPIEIEELSFLSGNNPDKRTVMWKLRPPHDLPYNQKFTYNAIVRLCYDYKTKASATVQFYSENEFYRKKPSLKNVKVVQSKSPLKIKINSKSPLIADNSLVLDITVKNIGTGIATLNSCDKPMRPKYEDFENINAFKIKIDGNECSVDNAPQYLDKGKETRLTVICSDFDVDFAQHPIEERQIDITLEYNYYYDTKSKVYVTGTRRDVGTNS